MRAIADYLVYLVVRVLICVVQALPLETCERIAGGLATVFSDWLHIRGKVVEENLQHAYPALSERQRRRLAWRMWRHLFLMVMEIAVARRKLNHVNWRKNVTLYNDADLVRALISPRPPVLVTAHYGNFEIAGYLLGMFGFPTVTVARTLDNQYLDRFLNNFRGATGQYMVEKNGTAEEIARYQERGAMLTLLGDQAAGKKGCWVDFFGRPASAHKAIALFSLGNNSPLMVVFARRIGGAMKYEAGIEALADPAAPGFDMGTIPDLTQWFTARLEDVIRVAPDQYWWLHRRWKGEPAKRKQAKAA